MAIEGTFSSSSDEEDADEDDDDAEECRDRGISLSSEGSSDFRGTSFSPVSSSTEFPLCSFAAGEGDSSDFCIE